jgi:glycosyltransferase 2 family protein
MVVILGLLVWFLLPRLDTIEESFKTLHTLRPWAIALAIIMEALSYTAMGALLQSVVGLTGHDRIGLRRSIAIEIGAGAVSLVAAGALGFGAAIYKWTRNGGVSQETSMLASWLPSMFDSVTLALFALAGASELLFFHRLSRPTMIALGIVVSGLALAVAAIILLIEKSDWLLRFSHRMTRVLMRIRLLRDDALLHEAAERAANTWKNMRKGGWVRPMICSLLVLTFDLLCLRYAFLAAGVSPHLSMLLAGYGVPILLGRASFLPGGIAVIEVAMAALFGGLGVPASVAVVAVLTYRLISFWLPALAGIPMAITLQSRRKSV